MPHPKVSFFTDGDLIPQGSSHIFINSCYVQYIAPSSEPTTEQPPLLFIHGGGLTGSQWETTPDRRQGWAVRAAEQGRHVYVMDGVDSGRSQRAPDHIRDGEAEWRDAKQMWERFRFGPVEGWAERRGFPGSAFDVRYLDRLVAMQAVRRRDTDITEGQAIDKVLQELASDGPVDVCAHSHGAALLIQISQDVKHLLNDVVLVEPAATSGTNFACDKYLPLVVWGDFIEESEIWTPIKKMFDKSRTEAMTLRDLGIYGNSHFPMLDDNSNVVWDKISDWFDQRDCARRSPGS